MDSLQDFSDNYCGAGSGYGFEGLLKLFKQKMAERHSVVRWTHTKEMNLFLHFRAWDRLQPIVEVPLECNFHHVPLPTSSELHHLHSQISFSLLYTTSWQTPRSGIFHRWIHTMHHWFIVEPRIRAGIYRLCNSRRRAEKFKCLSLPVSVMYLNAWPFLSM